MRLPQTKSLLTAASLLAAVGVVPLVMATPASATPRACENYVGNKGYIVGPKVRQACSHRHTGPAPSSVCLIQLIDAGVHSDVALSACRLA